MAELKHISEVEQVAEVQENDSLIGERDGRAVRIPSSKVVPEGMVKSVNGTVPDANGDVQLEMPQGFSGSWNDLKDMPQKIFLLKTSVVEDYDGNHKNFEHEMNFTYEELRDALINFDKIPVFYWFIKIDYEDMHQTEIEGTAHLMERPAQIRVYTSKYGGEPYISLKNSFDGHTRRLQINEDGTVTVSDWTNT